jgi:hypothetical protein
MSQGEACEFCQQRKPDVHLLGCFHWACQDCFEKVTDRCPRCCDNICRLVGCKGKLKCPDCGITTCVGCCEDCNGCDIAYCNGCVDYCLTGCRLIYCNECTCLPCKVCESAQSKKRA